ncbi:MAG: serine/threonine protein kinase [candidate division Zixibacteria bacterium]|nr:serine/threonine protein kinase [candidate division Zixibacteria bacterium]
MEKILHYNLDKHLGDGKYGEYYLAWDGGLDRIILVEFLGPALALDDSFRDRFDNDMKKLADIDHEHIAGFYALQEGEGRLFVLREYVEGRTVKELIAESEFSYALFLGYAIQMTAGIKAAHEALILHRNIASQNIIVSDKKKVKLVNFGLPGKIDHIGLDEPPGAYDYYLAPEQTRNQFESPETDLYSLGMVFYEMLARDLPFKGATRRELFRSIQNDAPDFSTGPAAQIPPDGRLLIEKLLSKDGSDRFRDADELLITLQAMLDYHFNRSEISERHAKHKSPRTYLLLSVLVILIIIFWLVISTVYR